MTITKATLEARQAANNAKITHALATGKKECPKCGVVKELDMFSVNTRFKSGYSTDCRACLAAYKRKVKEKKSGKPVPQYVPPRTFASPWAALGAEARPDWSRL